MKQFIARIPLIGTLAKYLYHHFCRSKEIEVETLPQTEPVIFDGSQSYWENRYVTGGNSGVGSYGKLAEFKSQVVNSFVKENNINSIIEFGCGDGNQLSLAVYPKYIGLDVSPTAIKLCKEKFHDDDTKSFFLYDPLCFVDKHNIFSCDLALSMDVIYHLVEDDIFHKYMQALFGCSKKYVIIYSSNYDTQQVFHIRDRQFTPWVAQYASEWQLINVIKNKYPEDPKYPDETARSDFYIFAKSSMLKQ